MKFFSIIILVIAILYLLTCLRSPIVIAYYKHVYKKLTNYKNKDFADFYVLLPALREQKLVESTLKHFNSLKYPKEKLHIFVVTTEKESKGNIPTTKEEVIKFINSNTTNFETLNIHYPETVGYKSSQLNYAIKSLIKERSLKKNTYFCVFDFDSRPDKNFFILANKAVELYNEPDIVQAVPFFVNNIYELSKKTKNFLTIIHGVEQAVRSANIEIWRLMVNGKNLPLAPQYAMGASLIVKTKALMEEGYFPEPVDDLPLGFRYFINKRRFKLLPSMIMGDLPEKPSQVFSQSVFIQKGNLLALKEIKRKGTAKHTFYRRFLIFYEFLSVFLEKTIIPYIFLIYLILNIWNFQWVSLLVIALPFIRFLSGSIIIKVLTKQKIKLSTFLLSFAFSFLTSFCLTYGPFKNIQIIIYKKLTKNEVEFKKTER